jgi:membrane-associated protein
MVRRLIEAFLSIPSGWVLAALFVVPALETAVLVGFVLPGESVVLLGGVLAARGRVGLAPALLASVVGPLTGDVVGYFLGRRYGQEIVRARLGRRWDRAHRWLSREGGWPVFVARFLPFVRTVLPTTAGAIRAPKFRFLAWDLSAVVIWGVGTCLLGYAAARNYERVLKRMSGIGLAALAVALVVVVFLVARSRRRAPARRKASVAG